MARVAVIAARDRLAEPLVRALRDSPHVERCERVVPDIDTIDAARLEGFDTAVYTALPADGVDICPNVEPVRAISERLARLPLRHTILLSSAAIYGPTHMNVGRLDETTFIPEGRNAIADRWREVEQHASLAGQRSGAAARVRTVLRPAAVLDGGDYFSRLLTGRIAVTCPGHDPTVQLLSPRDLAAAMAVVIAQRAEGVYNVAPAGGIPLREALRLAGVTRLPIARVLQGAARAVTAPAALSVSADQLAYIRYSWTVSGEKLQRTCGFTPSRSSAHAILELLGRDGASCTHNLPSFDDYGLDAAYVRRYCGHLFRFLHDYYWRVEIDGIAQVPRHGPGVLVGMHRGFMPFDGVMALYALVTRLDRIPRFLIHPSLTKFPFLADFMAKLGGVMACQQNADYLLQRGELLGVFPEGIRGAFTMYDRAYTLGKFSRDEFVRMAIRSRAPILPFVTVGSAEIYPIVGRLDWRWFKRYTEWPFLPITPAPFPLPSKWHTRFLPPIHVEEQLANGSADDPQTVRRISLDVRQRMQRALDDMLPRRRSIFFGSIFNGAAPS